MWTGKRVKVLKKLWADGVYASQIALQLGGVTRSAVISKARKLKLASRKDVPKLGRPRRSPLKLPKPPKIRVVKTVEREAERLVQRRERRSLPHELTDFLIDDTGFEEGLTHSERAAFAKFLEPV